MTSTDRPAYFPTKYDSARDEVIARLSDETEGYGNRDDSSGEADAPTGYFALVTIPADVTFPSSPLDAYSYSADAVANEYGVTPPDVIGSHIVTWNSQGFVSVETFETEEAAREEYDCRADRYAEWSDEDYEDNEGRVYVCKVAGHGYHTL